MQLRFASFVVINLRRDLHPQECAQHGRTKQNAHWMWAPWGVRLFVSRNFLSSPSL